MRNPIKKAIKWFLIIGIILLVVFVCSYAWRALPIISGYGTKNMASAVFLQQRNPADVLKEDLGNFPISLGSYTVNFKDSSVTGSVFGLAKQKAIYRKGIGCTLINDYTEQEVRAQHFILPSIPLSNRDGIPWPVGEKIDTSMPAVINGPVLQKAVDNIMTTKVNGQPTYSTAVLIVYDGKIVAEKYAPGYTKNTVMLGWSMSKSLTGALIGILAKEGKLVPALPAPVPEWKGTKKERITTEQLLQQTSGLDFEEEYDKPCEVTNMLFKEGNMAAFTARLPLKYQPGSVFYYSSGNSNLLSRIIRQTVGEKDYAAFPFNALFHRINMYSVVLEPDASGTYIGSSYSYATARDFARFGLLFYNKGTWNGEQILPATWVAKSVRASPANKQKHYGYQFWLNGFAEDGITRLFPDVPADMFYASGYGGQHIFIIPSKKLVVVRTGLQRINENKFLKEVIAAIGE